jgi:hypothetical protein
MRSLRYQLDEGSFPLVWYNATGDGLIKELSYRGCEHSSSQVQEPRRDEVEPSGCRSQVIEDAENFHLSDETEQLFWSSEFWPGRSVR